MADRMTSIQLPGTSGNSALADYGRKTVPEMVELIRARAQAMKAEAEAILAAADTDFRVATYVGVYVQRDYVLLQRGKS